MSFRARLLILFTLTIAGAVALVTLGVMTTSRRAFEQQDSNHSEAFVAEFQREFARRGQDIAGNVQDIAQAEGTLRMAIELSRPQADPSLYVSDARGLAASHQFDFLELVASDGTIISSAQWPARFGYKNDWVAQPQDWAAQGAFLKREELPDGPALALLAVSTVTVGERKIYVVGGQRLAKEFLASLVLPSGMRALLYQNLDANFSPQDLTDTNGPLGQAEKFAPLIDEERLHPGELSALVRWTDDKASAESFHAWPLLGRQKELLGVLLVGSSRRDLVLMERWIFMLALAVAAGGVLFGVLLSLWASARISRPVRKLAEAAREVAAGRWNTHVDVRSRDEMGELARAFNKMTGQLAEQRDRLLQAERVAAWREVARRLAHELKNPLFPMQITVENLQRAREQKPDQFDEVFRESAATLLAELENLKTIIGRFSDFARMPAPELRPVNLNEIARGVVKLFEAQFSAVGRPQITPEMYLDEKLPVIHADASLLHRALENLVLNAMDAMPGGGTLSVRTGHHDGMVRLDISDSGSGLTREECERLFTPYYTTKQHGTGLGLAIVQSVVSDHGGTIAVESEPGSGTTFRIELPDRPPVHLVQAPAAPQKRPVAAEV